MACTAGKQRCLLANDSGDQSTGLNANRGLRRLGSNNAGAEQAMRAKAYDNTDDGQPYPKLDRGPALHLRSSRNEGDGSAHVTGCWSRAR